MVFCPKVNRIIFCVFLEKDFKIYQRKLCKYFPPDTGKKEESDGGGATDECTTPAGDNTAVAESNSLVLKMVTLTYKLFFLNSIRESI